MRSQEFKSTYVIISPVRNEGEYLEATIEAVSKQTILPVEWVIVNDGSTDKTREIIDSAAARYPWIRAVHRPDRGYRKAGGGVIEAFNDGFSALSVTDWAFLVKLDGDLTFENNYFEKCFREFDADKSLGIGGGTVAHIIDNKPEIEAGPTFHVRGATKIYRRECWEMIGGLIVAPGWDTLDEVKANMLGWTTRTFPHLQLIHHRFTGSADGSWRNWVKNGRANYITGYHPLFMLLKCMRRFLRPPYAIASVGLFWGYISGCLQRVPQVPDKMLVQYVRRQQIRRIFLMDSIWH